MIALTSQHKCKIWLNESFHSNCFSSIPIEESVFLRLIFKMMAESSNKLKNTVGFFAEINKCKTFCQALSFI
jgi:hypothetical protein